MRPILLPSASAARKIYTFWQEFKPLLAEGKIKSVTPMDSMVFSCRDAEQLDSGTCKRSANHRPYRAGGNTGSRTTQ
jgi:hypothetical protein